MNVEADSVVFESISTAPTAAIGSVLIASSETQSSSEVISNGIAKSSTSSVTLSQESQSSVSVAESSFTSSTTNGDSSLSSTAVPIRAEISVSKPIVTSGSHYEHETVEYNGGGHSITSNGYTKYTKKQVTTNGKHSSGEDDDDDVNRAIVETKNRYLKIQLGQEQVYKQKIEVLQHQLHEEQLRVEQQKKHIELLHLQVLDHGEVTSQQKNAQFVTSHEMTVTKKKLIVLEQKLQQETMLKEQLEKQTLLIRQQNEYLQIQVLENNQQGVVERLESEKLELAKHVQYLKQQLRQEQVFKQQQIVLHREQLAEMQRKLKVQVELTAEYERKQLKKKKKHSNTHIEYTSVEGHYAKEHSQNAHLIRKLQAQIEEQSKELHRLRHVLTSWESKYEMVEWKLNQVKFDLDESNKHIKVLLIQIEGLNQQLREETSENSSLKVQLENSRLVIVGESTKIRDLVVKIELSQQTLIDEQERRRDLESQLIIVNQQLKIERERWESDEARWLTLQGEHKEFSSFKKIAKHLIKEIKEIKSETSTVDDSFDKWNQIFIQMGIDNQKCRDDDIAKLIALIEGKFAVEHHHSCHEKPGSGVVETDHEDSNAIVKIELELSLEKETRVRIEVELKHLRATLRERELEIERIRRDYEKQISILKKQLHDEKHAVKESNQLVIVWQQKCTTAQLHSQKCDLTIVHLNAQLTELTKTKLHLEKLLKSCEARLEEESRNCKVQASLVVEIRVKLDEEVRRRERLEYQYAELQKTFRIEQEQRRKLQVTYDSLLVTSRQTAELKIKLEWELKNTQSLLVDERNHTLKLKKQLADLQIVLRTKEQEITKLVADLQYSERLVKETNVKLVKIELELSTLRRTQTVVSGPAYIKDHEHEHRHCQEKLNSCKTTIKNLTSELHTVKHHHAQLSHQYKLINIQLTQERTKNAEHTSQITTEYSEIEHLTHQQGLVIRSLQEKIIVREKEITSLIAQFQRFVLKFADVDDHRKSVIREQEAKQFLGVLKEQELQYQQERSSHGYLQLMSYTAGCGTVSKRVHCTTSSGGSITSSGASSLPANVGGNLGGYGTSYSSLTASGDVDFGLMHLH